MINVGDKFRLIWGSENGEQSAPFTLLLKEDGLWWAKNHQDRTVAFNPLSSDIHLIIKEE